MSLVIPVAHDFSCAWCYIGAFQVRALQAEFDVTFDWLSYELFPVGLESTPTLPAPPEPENKPKTPSRFQLALAAQGIDLPKIQRPKDIVTRPALLATEFIKQSQSPQPFIFDVYSAYWDQGADISDLSVLLNLAQPYVANIDNLRESILSGEFASRITEFDEPAYSSGVYNLPTFWIGGARYAEQPLRALQRALTAIIEPHGALR